MPAHRVGNRPAAIASGPCSDAVNPVQPEWICLTRLARSFDEGQGFQPIEGFPWGAQPRSRKAQPIQRGLDQRQRQRTLETRVASDRQLGHLSQAPQIRRKSSREPVPVQIERHHAAKRVGHDPVPLVQSGAADPPVGNCPARARPPARTMTSAPSSRTRCRRDPRIPPSLPANRRTR